ncbi:TPA: hypothetical protein IUV20_002573 [Enterococcus faecalis]|nr:hypothetical protein [Enterococcus faecalis]
MRIVSNRRCYNSYHVPFETLAYASWPPTYVTCDCGNLAKHIVRFRLLEGGAPHFQDTFIWKCEECGTCYRQRKGTFDFERVEEKREKEDAEKGTTN